VLNKVLTPFAGWRLEAPLLTQGNSGATVLFERFIVCLVRKSRTLLKCVTHCGNGATSALRIKNAYNKKGPTRDSLAGPFLFNA
jgi:hypothetical protein